jgi:hypothetical protein
MKIVNVVDKDEILRFENVLHEVLRPVGPRSEFVAQLKQRLGDEPRPVITYPRRNTFRLVLLAAASLVSGIFLVLNGARMILSFIAALGFWREMRRQSNGKRFVTPRLAL